MTEPSSCADEPSSALYLPKPTGPHPVGATSVYLNDVSRHDPCRIGTGADLPPTRTLHITRSYTRASFGLQLGNRPQPLLDKPSMRYPEVEFCSPGTMTCHCEGLPA